MAQPFMGEMRLMAFGFAPRGWARCDGTLMSIAQNQALFAILGTSFGGDGVSTFGLPDMRGRVPVGTGGNYHLGQMGGEETHLLTAGEVLPHTHAVQGLAASAGDPNPVGKLFATTATSSSSINTYSVPSAKLQTLPAKTVSPAGTNTPHPNIQPYQVITVAIALQGVFPSRN